MPTAQKTNRIYPLLQRIASWKYVSWFLSHTLHHLDRWLFGASNGRFTAATIFTGLPIVTLTAIGAKSGQPRSVPLVGIPDDDKFILIASNFGKTRHPAWYYNLMAFPTCTLDKNGTKKTYTARQAVGEEREVYWQKAVEIYAGYDLYKQRTNGRLIPIMVLEPGER